VRNVSDVSDIRGGQVQSPGGAVGYFQFRFGELDARLQVIAIRQRDAVATFAAAPFPRPTFPTPPRVTSNGKLAGSAISAVLSAMGDVLRLLTGHIQPLQMPRTQTGNFRNR
jgi:hypothetical protein